MSFANPVFFWALISLIPLAAIYLLKVRPVRKPTTAWFLWQDILRQKRATSLLHRLRDLLSLLLMAAAFTAVVLAMTQPFWTGVDRNDIVLVVDNSASMNAKDGRGTRLDSAIAAARQIVRGLGGNQRCSIATVANELVLQTHLTKNSKALLDAIDRIKATELPLDPAVWSSLADRESEVDSSRLSSSRGSEDADSAEELGLAPKRITDETESNKYEVRKNQHRVILITDGCLDPEALAEVEVLRVGDEPEGNIGIVACDLSRLQGGSNRVGFFFRVASTFAETVSVDLALSHGDPENIVRLIPLELPPGTGEAEIFDVEDAEHGRWFARLEIDDALSTDNAAFLNLPPRRPIRVAVDATDRFFFENSVLAFANAGELLQLVDRDPQLTVVQGAMPAAVKESPEDLVVFQPAGESDLWSDVGEEIEVAKVKVVDADHPLLRHIDAGTIRFIGAKKLTPGAGAEVLVESADGTPLIFRASRAGRSAVIVNMDPLASDFYFSAWFPALVYSSAMVLSGREQRIASTNPAGSRVFVPGFEIGSETIMTSPTAESRAVTTQIDGPLNKTGFYRVENANGQWDVGCSLISPTETAIDRRVPDSSRDVQRGLSPARWLTIIALLVVVAEALLYQRRKVG